MKQPKKPVKPIDFQKALSEKSANEFIKSIKTGKLYKELRPKKSK